MEADLKQSKFSVTILLSTYNGSRFLEEQLRSIIEQNFTEWKLIIRDDNSTDDTLSIIDKYCRLHSGKVIHVTDAKGNLGVKHSFSELLGYVDTPYAAFCDQDDIWHKDKLSTLMDHLIRGEKRQGADIPLVVFSDLVVIDENRNVLSNSFLAYSGLKAAFVQDNTILCRNAAPGCSMLFNRALIQTAGSIPEAAVMHDYWFMLVARYRGKIIFEARPLVDYRQHGNNQLGARATGELKWSKIWRGFRWYLKGAEFYLDRFLPYQQQARELLTCSNLSNDSKVAILAFCNLVPAVSRWKRKRNIIVHKLKAGGFRENIELILCG